ncbi:MAG: hypothetical protein JXA21_24990 [Anaerolineae bacterium]|nr:hypothetical protein [Anaerolineae bacterium]
MVRNHKKLLGLAVWVFMLGVLVWLPTLGEAQTPGSATSSAWVTVFTDTFTTLSPDWVITDTVAGQYHWGTSAYTRTTGTVIIPDTGLWAVGGGTLGSAQFWPEGTYPSEMSTWAIIGPFTPTQKVWDMQVRFWLDNRLASGDAVFVGLSRDGVKFQGIELTATFTLTQEVVWTTPVTDSAPVWLGLSFSSSDENVATGPLLDDLRLMFNYGSTSYLPFILREPTFTPSPTLTPSPTFTPSPTTPAFYMDHFDDPSSGWHTGAVMRYNEWCYVDKGCHSGLEEVTNLSYVDGNYRFYVPTSWHGGGGNVDTWFVWPVETAPLPAAYYPLPQNYCIEAYGRFMGDEEFAPWWAHWGIVFGANSNLSEVYSLQVNANHDRAVLYHHNYTYPGNRQPLDGSDVNIETALVSWGGEYDWIPSHAYNHLKVVVQGRYVQFFVNGHHITTIRTPYVLPRDYIGLISGSWEVTPIDLRVDYFRYEPNCPEAQTVR